MAVVAVVQFFMGLSLVSNNQFLLILSFVSSCTD